MGIVLHTLFSIGNTYQLQQLHSPLVGCVLTHICMQEHAFHDLLADLHGRVQAGHRILEDHGDMLAVDAGPQVFAGKLQKVDDLFFSVLHTAVENLTPVDDTVGIQKTRCCLHGDRFTGTALSYDGNGLTLLEIQVDAADCMDHSGTGLKCDVKIFDLKYGFFVHLISPPSHIFQLRCQGFPETIADEVKAQHQKRQYSDRRNDLIGQCCYVVESILDQGTDGTLGQNDTDTDEAEESLGEDGGRDREHDLGDDRSDGIGQDLFEDDMHARRAEGPAGQDILLLLQLEHLRTGDLAHADPLGQKQSHDNQEHALGHEDGQDRYDNQTRHAVGHLNKTLHDAVSQTAEISGDQAVAHTDDHIDQNGDESDDQADTCPVPGSGPEVTAQVIRTEEEKSVGKKRIDILAAQDTRDMGRDRPGNDIFTFSIVHRDDVLVAIAAENGSEDGKNDDHGDNDQACHGLLVMQDVQCNALPVALGGEVGIHRDIAVLEEDEVFLLRNIFTIH